MNELDKVISIALNEEGYLEKKSNKDLDDKTANAGSNNYTKYARDLDNISGFYNGKKQGYAWCDVFVDWCFVKSFGVERAKELLCQPSKSLGAGVYYSMEYYKKKNQFYETLPRVGDQIFFKNSKGNAQHTGLVYQIDKTYVYTIEGNTSSSSGVIPNGGCVRLKKYDLSYKYIIGYGRPIYNVIKSTYQGIFPKLRLGIFGWKKGDKGNKNIGYLQAFLNWVLDLTGTKEELKIDNSFGPLTDKAVRKYQKTYDLVVDGKFGPACLKKAKTIEK